MMRDAQPRTDSETGEVRVPIDLFDVDVHQGAGELVLTCGEARTLRDHLVGQLDIVTQVDDGASDGHGIPTSSSSKPSVMLEMLALSGLAPGERVFEIGTATGMNTAWMCERLGAENVTTMEYDERLFPDGRRNLRLAGYGPTVLVGDGLKGSPERAPFDVILATCALKVVPEALLRQVRDGGTIVAPFGTAFHSFSYLKLDVEDGRARGRFTGDPDFMWARQQRSRYAAVEDIYNGEDGTAGTTRVSPYELWHQGDTEFWIGLHVPGVWAQLHQAGEDAPGEATYWLLADDRKSWATVEFTEGGQEYATEQYGPRRLWSEVADAYRSWQDSGRPGRGEFGLTATAHGGQVWLREPTEVVATLW
ncbi:methyltransferase domain-containing protein [Streptomyces sp. NPDC050448]|uniref:methyltransferase domain-containing protein n=1 Tax=Streptomyces sp. NPDC050448 TaxID=3155404 RepID=UPI00341EB603